MATNKQTEVVQMAPKELLNTAFGQAMEAMRADNEGVYEETLLRIMNGSSVDDILGEDTVLHLRDHLGKTFTLLSATIMKSDKEGGLGGFLVMTVRFDGKLFDEIMTTGAATILAQVISLTKNNLLPVRVKAKETDKPTASGQYPMSLVKGDEIETPF
jgi:hypothetical protein